MGVYAEVDGRFLRFTGAVAKAIHQLIYPRRVNAGITLTKSQVQDVLALMLVALQAQHTLATIRDIVSLQGDLDTFTHLYTWFQDSADGATLTFC